MKVLIRLKKGRVMNKNQSIGMYIILGIMVLAFVSMLFSGPTSSTQELSYTTFLQKVENKEIKSVDMMKDSLVALPINQPEQILCMVMLSLQNCNIK